MVATLQQIIGKVNPQLYAENSKELIKKYKSSKEIKSEEVKPKSLSKHSLVYDSSTETLEPIYFFTLDLMSDFGLKPEKITDNFVSSPGSGHFSELRQKASIMQQQAVKTLGDINTVLRSIMNIIYDLKDFKIRLQSYDDAHSANKDKKEAGILVLKQIWMDRVDIAKGAGSINGLTTGQLGFQTLRDAFLVVKDETLKGADGKEIDLNDRVKRILRPRILEFNTWLEQSEKELRKRYELERTYLKSQVNSLKLYSRWAKPYLKAEYDLEMKEPGKEPSLVKTFDTILLELCLLGKSKLDIPSGIDNPKTRRDYYACVIVNFNFRGIPSRVQGRYVFGGKTRIEFTAYALNEDEMKMVEKELDSSDLKDPLKLIEGSTTESLGQLYDEINFFLEEEEQKKPEKVVDVSNPFLALIGHYNKSEMPKKDTKESDKPIPQDNWVEKTHLRPLAIEKSKDTAFKLFDIYKKAHRMPSYT